MFTEGPPSSAAAAATAAHTIFVWDGSFIILDSKCCRVSHAVVVSLCMSSSL
jgi:hypothetical protein